MNTVERFLSEVIENREWSNLLKNLGFFTCEAWIQVLIIFHWSLVFVCFIFGSIWRTKHKMVSKHHVVLLHNLVFVLTTYVLVYSSYIFIIYVKNSSIYVFESLKKMLRNKEVIAKQYFEVSCNIFQYLERIWWFNKFFGPKNSKIWFLSFSTLWHDNFSNWFYETYIYN